MTSNLPWWKRSVVYQIYPRSFHDSDGDGIGDLRGIHEKLDHLADLGVDVLWLSPIFDSPMDDNGYDIRDYRAIDADFGTLDDLDALLEATHERGMRLILDLVVNHTSDEHAWFESSRSSHDDPKRDWYIWRPPGPDGGPPNNWASFFGGSAWEFDDRTGEYFLHLFSRKQPDLNWENPAVRDAVVDLTTWWLDRGVDGFRLDAINLIAKPDGLPDAEVIAPERAYQVPFVAFNGPNLLPYLRELRSRAFAGREVLTVGETAMVEAPYGLELTHARTGGLGMVHQFEFTELDKDRSSVAPRWVHKPLDLAAFKRVFARWQRTLEPDGWNANFLSNHDLPRPVSRYGDDGAHRRESAKLLATLVLLLKGTPFLYQGDELGMTNVAFPSIDDYRDVETLQAFEEYTDLGVAPAEVMRWIHARSRDNARTPVQWSGGPNAGFTTGTPWIPVNPNYTEIHAAAQRADPASVLAYHRALIALRAATPAAIEGRFELLLPDHDRLFVFTRTSDDDRLLVALNFSGEPTEVPMPAPFAARDGELLLANYHDAAGGPLAGLELRPWEARVLRVPLT